MRKKSKRLIRIHRKAHSYYIIQDLISGSEGLEKSRAFYVDLKESQKMNLYSAIRLKVIALKRRYKSFIVAIQDMQGKFKSGPVCRVMPSPKNLANISPITASESRFISTIFSISYERQCLIETKSDLVRLLEKIQIEICAIIEGSCHAKESLKAIDDE